jgi:hypothetical protein
MADIGKSVINIVISYSVDYTERQEGIDKIVVQATEPESVSYPLLIGMLDMAKNELAEGGFYMLFDSNWNEIDDGEGEE